MEQSILDLFKLNGKTAMIVGGNRGLGLAMGKALAEAGANIAIAARDDKKSAESEATIKSNYKVGCMSTHCDVVSESSVQSAVDKIISEFGHIDILINSA